MAEEETDVIANGRSEDNNNKKSSINIENNLLTDNSCTVDKLKSIIESSEKDPSLLNLVQQENVKQRNKPSSYFSFPGARGSMISLPPFQKWPSQMGWSFSTWINLDSKACAQPYLYNFKTGKSGLGYSAHFTGNCLVLTSIRVKGKGVQNCVAYEFPSNKWIHCAITYHNRWRASEVRIYVNGQLLPTIEIAWQVQTSEIFDKCFIGGSGTLANIERSGELNSFCGQMSATYLFNEGLSAAQICAIHRLGPSYMGQFRYSNESVVDLPPMISKSLYDGKLASSLFCLYSPVAVDGETLCIQLAPLKSSTTTPAPNYFLSAPHAALLGETKAINSQPICSTIQSIGCSSSLLPLLDQFAASNQSEACAFLIGFLCDLLESSPHWFANEIVQNNGFVMIACSLARNPKILISERILDIFLNLSRSLITAASPIGGSLLLKHLVDNILFNPSLWIFADTKLQLKLYNYLSNEFLNGTRRTTNNKYTISSNNDSTATTPTSTSATPSTTTTIPHSIPSSSATLAIQQQQSIDDQNHQQQQQLITITDILFGEIRRVSTVLQSLHALKYYYWIEEEKSINVKARDLSQRPSRADLSIIRQQLLQFMSELIIRSNSVPLDETQGILNYLATCEEAENLADVLDNLFQLVSDHSIYMVPALEQKQASKVIYGLLSSQSELIRVKTLRLLTLFLAKCSYKRKQEIMGPNNLFMLLCDKLKTSLPLTIETYEALIDLMLEQVETVQSMREARNLRKKRIENSILIKVIATLLKEEFNMGNNKSNVTNNKKEPPGALTSSVNIRDRFINDLWTLIVNSRENRRIILQMSVWQHWLINLIGNTLTDSQLVRDQVLAIFRVLLYHATRYEYGGWRVWIDTLAIIHTKISFDEFLMNHTSPPLSPMPTTTDLSEAEQISEQSASRFSVDDSKSIRSAHEDATVSNDDELDHRGHDEVYADSVAAGPQTVTISGAETSATEIEAPRVEVGESTPSQNNDEISRDFAKVDLVDDKTQIDSDKPPVEVDATKSSAEEGLDKQDDKTKRKEERIAEEMIQDIEPKIVASICDSVDLAPSRAFRQMRVDDTPVKRVDGVSAIIGSNNMSPKTSTTDASPSRNIVNNSETRAESNSPGGISHSTMTSIPLDDDDKSISCSPEHTKKINSESDQNQVETSPTIKQGDGGDIEEQFTKCEPEIIVEEVMQKGVINRQQQQQQRCPQQVHPTKVTASPAFRIPEFRWSPVLVKLLNDLIFSIECDLYNWRCSGNCMNMELGPFVPRSTALNVAQSNSAASSSSGASSTGSSANRTAATVFFEQILQKPENQVYLINIIHFISQLADNIIISAGGLLPLLAEATGGNNRSLPSSGSGSPDAANANNNEDQSSTSSTSSAAFDRDLLRLNESCEGLMMKQANSLLYRLTNMIDVVILAASHINLNELEADKNSTSGGILRQCLRLACTLTVKNCLVIRSITNKMQQQQQSAINNNGKRMLLQSIEQLTEVEFPKDFFDSYHGCSILSANNLFATTLDANCDLVANVEYSSNQTPNSSSMPSLLPFQCNPIKDGNKLLQAIDVARIQACIYHNTNLEARESQFLALSSLYFISVLMVSKYRDIIEPKTTPSTSSARKHQPPNATEAPPAGVAAAGSSGEQQQQMASERNSPDSGVQNSGNSTAAATATAVAPDQVAAAAGTSESTTESNLLNFGRMQPTESQKSQQQLAGHTLTDILTSRLENTLDVVCPLLKSVMCDFCAFLSRTLVGSHGQDLVNKEADRAFKRANTSPVELVMLLCSQEWQNTLQKNAGLAFIELINEGRMSSIGMKEHIVRVAMEAEFILSRLRADDVTKNEQFQLASAELLESRLNEEMLINNLICSASRRDFAIYRKFCDANELRKTGFEHGELKLDIWEDDDRRMRRFVIDSYRDQLYYVKPASRSNPNSIMNASNNNDTSEGDKDKERIVELHESHDLSGHHTISASMNMTNNNNDSSNHNFYRGSTSRSGHDEFDTQDDPNNPMDCLGGEDDQDNLRNTNVNANDSEEDDSDIENKNQDQRGRLSSVDEVECVIGKGGGKRVEQSSLNYATSLKRQHRRRGQNNNISRQYSETISTGGGGNGELSGTAIFAADCSLVWSIYSIPGVLSLSHNELYFEPNQNISEALDALKREPDSEHELVLENLIPAPDPDNLASHYHAHLVYLKSPVSSSNNSNNNNNSQAANKNNGGGDKHASKQHQTFIKTYATLRKSDLKVLRYCDFLTGDAKISLSDIRAIFSRHYLLQSQALEIFVAQRSSVMFSFLDSDSMRRMVRYLPPVGVGIKYGIAQSRRASLMSGRQLFEASNMTQKWQRREIGNFQYLMFLNTIAGRSYQDLNQYPVFPWILTNYEDQELDLTLPSNFRDLSKPVGALNSRRRAEFIERYSSWDNPKVPAFHYGTHYSTAAFTLNWLCRLRGNPNQAYLALHDGSYEEKSRLFMSIQDSWLSSLTSGQQNVKELIPEFFYLPEMFHSQLGLPVVELPPWAKSPEHFVRLHRLALESELVSCQLHQWIDLIFGYKQRGPEATTAINTFYYLTYQGNVNLNMIQEPALREAIETQIKHFGQTPSQLTTEPHPPRFSPLHVSPSVFTPSSGDELTKAIKFPFNTSITHIAACVDMSQGMLAGLIEPAGSSVGTIPNPSSTDGINTILTITSNNQFQLHKWAIGQQSTSSASSSLAIGDATVNAATPAQQNSNNPSGASNNNNHLATHQPGPVFIMDPQLETSSAANRRQLIDVDDLCSSISLKLATTTQTSKSTAETPLYKLKSEVAWPNAHFVVTLDGRFIIMGSFYDNSFRVFSTANGKLCQVIYGHRAPLTCIARSEGNANADFTLATGSKDCSLLLWTWNERYAQVEGSGVSAVHNPLPKLSISGHRTPVLSAVICTELGIILSGSKNLILANTTTNGENLLSIDVSLTRLLDKSSRRLRAKLEEVESEQQELTSATDDRQRDNCNATSARPQVADKEKTLLEASMMGDSGRALNKQKLSAPATGDVRDNPISERDCESARASPCAESLSRSLEKFAHLRNLPASDYYITNIRLARELAYIVVLALPPPRENSKRHQQQQMDTDVATTNTSASALLMTFNLKGDLIECSTVGQSLNGPRLGDTSLLQTTRDGEHLILNDSPSSLKIIRTFDLQPVYAFNTNDLPPASTTPTNAPNNKTTDLETPTPADNNRVRSLLVLDHKYLVVGMDNGKLVIYNADFKHF